MSLCPLRLPTKDKPAASLAEYSLMLLLLSEAATDVESELAATLKT